MRQVIIFTRDIYFLAILEQKAEHSHTPDLSVATKFVRVSTLDTWLKDEAF